MLERLVTTMGVHLHGRMNLDTETDLRPRQRVCVPPNTAIELTALRAAAHSQRWTARDHGPMRLLRFMALAAFALGLSLGTGVGSGECEIARRPGYAVRLSFALSQARDGLTGHLACFMHERAHS